MKMKHNGIYLALIRIPRFVFCHASIRNSQYQITNRGIRIKARYMALFSILNIKAPLM